VTLTGGALVTSSVASHLLPAGKPSSSQLTDIVAGGGGGGAGAGAADGVMLVRLLRYLAFNPSREDKQDRPTDAGETRAQLGQRNTRHTHTHRMCPQTDGQMQHLRHVPRHRPRRVRQRGGVACAKHAAIAVRGVVVESRAVTGAPRTRCLALRHGQPGHVGSVGAV
jgi:hypothetical protein